MSYVLLTNTIIKKRSTPLTDRAFEPDLEMSLASAV